METPVKTQDGKTGATVRYRFYYEKIWNITITANSPKPGECNYSAGTLDETLAKPLHPLERVYDLTRVDPSDRTSAIRNPYDHVGSCTE